MTPNTKKVKESIIETNDIVHPSDVNAYGFVFGGHLVSLMDKTACMAAFKHCEAKVTTVSVDGIHFLRPAPVGTMLTILASVNRAFSTSMEIGLKVTAWLPGQPSKDICRAYMTFVAIDEDGKPKKVPQIMPETKEEIRRYNNAAIRRTSRLELREKLLSE